MTRVRFALCDFFTFLYARLAQVTCIDEEKKVVGEGSSGSTNFNSVGQEKANQHLREAILSALKAAGVPEDQGWSLGPTTSAEAAPFRADVSLFLSLVATLPVAGICLSMSGVDRPADKQLVRSPRAFTRSTPRIDLLTVFAIRCEAGSRPSCPMPGSTCTTTQWLRWSGMNIYLFIYLLLRRLTVLVDSGTDGNLFGLVVISGTGTITYGVNKEGETTRAAGWGYVRGLVRSTQNFDRSAHLPR
jgi:hypothetical protein